MAIITARSKPHCYNRRSVLGRTPGLEQGEMPKRPVEDVIRENVADIVRNYRDQQTFAKKVGKSNSTVSCWLSGERKISYEDLGTIADLERIHPASLLIDKKDRDGAPIPDLLTALRLIENQLKKS
jgi:transcriptional regulator with XRE-family HTH domain